MSRSSSFSADYDSTELPGQPDHLVDELNSLHNQVAQLFWVIENSQGVQGLRSDLTVMPWSQVIDLYVPALKERTNG